MNKMKFVVFGLIALFIIDMSMFIVFFRVSDKYKTTQNAEYHGPVTATGPITITITHGEIMIVEKKKD
jgi:hypothetical protein